MSNTINRRNHSSKKESHLSVAPFILGAILFMSIFQPAIARKPDTDKTAAAKADYIFAEAQRLMALDSIDSYFALVDQAYNINPSDKYLAKEYGWARTIMASPTDSASIDSGLKMMMDYLLENPADQTTGINIVKASSRYGRTQIALKALQILFDNDADPEIVVPAYVTALAQTGNPDSIRRAVTVVSRLESVSGITPETSLTKMRLFLLTADTASIESEINRLISAKPTDPTSYILAGDASKEIHNYDKALAYYNKAIELNPDFGQGYLSKALFYVTQGDTAAFDREVFRALQLPTLELTPKLEILHNYISHLYEDSTQTPRINNLFQSLVDQYPHEEEVRQLYGSFLMLVNDLPNAAEQFSYALDFNPDNEDLWTALAQINLSTDSFDQCITTVDNALHYFPSSSTLYMLGASASTLLNNLPKAQSYIDRGIALADTADSLTLASLYSTKGDIFYKLEDADSVNVYYNKALSFDSHNSTILNNYAYYISQQPDGNLQRALTLVENALRIERANKGTAQANTLDTYAWVLFKLKDFEKAREAINEALESDHDNDTPEFLEHAGDIYFMNGEYNDAVDFWKQALKLDPDNKLLRKKVKNKTFFPE